MTFEELKDKATRMNRNKRKDEYQFKVGLANEIKELNPNAKVDLKKSSIKALRRRKRKMEEDLERAESGEEPEPESPEIAEKRKQNQMKRFKEIIREARPKTADKMGLDELPFEALQNKARVAMKNKRIDDLNYKRQL